MVRIVVGDGRSDFCVAERADLVLAKGELVRHCQSADLPYFKFQSFSEATPLLGSWFEDGARTVDRRESLRDE